MNLNQFAKNNRFLMLALDHRGSFKKLMNPENPDSVSDGEAIELKKDIINSLVDQFSGVLIDQGIGLKAYQKRKKPFLLPVEQSGYTEKKGERITEIKYTVDDLKADGAGGAKILLYFNPSVPSAKVQLHTAKRVLQECKEKNFPLFLEIRVYKPDTGDEIGTDVEQLVLGSLNAFKENNINPHVWKLEYPGSFEGCKKITKIIGNTPWILLTKGSSFEDFVGMLKEASSAGCKGFLAGRALWQEVGRLQGEEKQNFLSKTLPERFKKISEVVLA
ncbi:MAG: Tagatose-1,6-bisphosphate aldolase [Candidatus Daviesbacteria bacterium GW2011_GWA2_38_24]|uniref:Tagatose-1,6-bisphosphate aldolase n=1 Tax=Candidatus Daviesbacteria bacterium GW2011_GWA2_38_24 TaxID=1618422 RepID=A0A0G0JI17_9BACT|nr:MAG: Tagatose-1,6-bisphosphate aldolase [Candidatus Daviesbacteria bacterium GW2011_GWA2_38_24]KKQ80390.1 MAG: Tagatose-1,6-bisphosphate aldolase [Candidatus Daviesbacteria bacterium GW2011_GWA1_38_7]OGE24713.1 MAG: hypothetical protein A2688_01740 [Candidatus Daviesbacteria bacterium RIFCSPHIGHO2_01_FULL_38_8]